MEHKHTPGQWRFTRPYTNANGKSQFRIETANGAIVMTGYCKLSADARLAATAPDLLLALEMLLEWHLGTSVDTEDAENYSAVREAVAAIAKATGTQP